MARSRLSFSLVGLFGLVTFACVTVAALKASTPLWASVVFSGALLILAFSLFGYRFGTKRRLWAGFAIFGWGYIVLAFGPWFETTARPNLLTSRLLVWTCERWHGAEFDERKVKFAGVAPAIIWDFVRSPSIPPVGSPSPPIDPEQFNRIGHSLFAILFADLGALAAGCFPDKRSPPPGN